MSKLSQLEALQDREVPTPPFRSLTHADYLARKLPVSGLRFPLAVRSSYHSEDGAEKSMAGHFTTRLYVEEAALPAAVEAVFASYPDPEGQVVILQEMIDPNYSGVLFAFRAGVWKTELTEGHPENTVAGRTRPRSFLLPRFSARDRSWSRFRRFWPGAPAGLFKPLVELSAYAGALLQHMDAPHGLDIEFAIADDRLYVLQARPITTPEEAESVLTTANHKEILPPRPSVLMTAIISRSGARLFDYYRELDPSLPPYSFIEQAAGMPWINLSALLDVMVHWGLPTRLVTASVGAEDAYQVGIRPWRMIRKASVFRRALARQWRVRDAVDDWLFSLPRREQERREHRSAQWSEAPDQAFRQWLNDFQQLYVELVTHMQDLTGAMAGPVQLLDRLGILGEVSGELPRKSSSSDYLAAFRDLQEGRIDRATFLRQFGHRGFYESDLSQPRFADYGETEWRRLLGTAQREGASPKADSRRPAGLIPANWWAWIFRRAIRLVRAREQLRHEVMRYFFAYRRELEAAGQSYLPAGGICWAYRPEDLERLFRSGRPGAPPAVEQSGWDMDTFLCNRLGRRLPLSVLENVGRSTASQNGIGIYPGKVRGRVWRVSQAELDNLQAPPFRPVILVADALDPGWIPYFAQVDGVLSYTGGLLSHASIILRESRIPAITQLPGPQPLRTGEWIEMNGRTGEVTRLKERKPDDSKFPHHG